MLIILSCSEAVGKRQLSRAIIAGLNDFSCDGKPITFEHDYNGNAIIKIDGINTDQIRDSNQELHSLALEKYRDIFIDGVKIWHTWGSHSDINVDYGIDDFSDNEEDVMLHNVNVLDMYKSRPFDNFVVSGIFSKTYLDKLVSAVGPDNIKVYNIIRNPSVSYLLDYKDDDFYDSPTKPNLSPVENKQKLMESFLTAAKLINVDYVETIRFEDIISGGLKILDTEIILPPGYIKFNNYITEHEKENHIPQDISEANNNLINFDPLWWDEKIIEGAPDSEINIMDVVEKYVSELKSIIPNVFDMYPGYKPMSYQDIIDNPK